MEADEGCAHGYRAVAEGGGQDLVYTAIVDLQANKVVATEPLQLGASAAHWNWQPVAVVVTDPDGKTNEIQLRKPRTRSVTREQSDPLVRGHQVPVAAAAVEAQGATDFTISSADDSRSGWREALPLMPASLRRATGHYG